MSQALNISTSRFVRYDSTPRKPVEPLLAEVAAKISELEADAGPQRLTIAEATDDIRELADDFADMVFDDSRGAKLDDLRRQLIDIMVSAARAYRDVCGDR